MTLRYYLSIVYMFNVFKCIKNNFPIWGTRQKSLHQCTLENTVSPGGYALPFPHGPMCRESSLDLSQGWCQVFKPHKMIKTMPFYCIIGGGILSIPSENSSCVLCWGLGLQDLTQSPQDEKSSSILNVEANRSKNGETHNNILNIHFFVVKK